MVDFQSCNLNEQVQSRREFLARSGFGFGAVALGCLHEEQAAFAATRKAAGLDNPLAPGTPHFPGKARNVIFMFMKGGPSHIDTFDPKPELARLDGQLLPPSFRPEDLSLQFVKAHEAKVMASPRKYRRYGQSGIEISDLFENLGRCADDLAVVRSCHHDSLIHGPAINLLFSGSVRLGHPTLGSWVVYGLGSESENFPGFVAMSEGNVTASDESLHGSGFLPAVYQATRARHEGTAFENLDPPPDITHGAQTRMLDQLQSWNRRHFETRRDDSRLAARIANYELAFRMQAAAPELTDLAGEPESVRRMYGLDQERTAKFGRICLLARRMVERGVRFVPLYKGNWDGHAQCDRNHVDNAGAIDQPVAGLLTDLKLRGLLESTLVVWIGEFGRTPVVQGDGGRDHNPHGFSCWMAGGGIRGGKVIGATDELGCRAIEDRVHVHDLHATMLSLLGLDHTKLTYLTQGRDMRLTDVGGYNDLSERLTRA